MPVINVTYDILNAFLICFSLCVLHTYVFSVSFFPCKALIYGFDKCFINKPAAVEDLGTGSPFSHMMHYSCRFYPQLVVSGFYKYYNDIILYINMELLLVVCGTSNQILNSEIGCFLLKCTLEVVSFSFLLLLNLFSINSIRKDLCPSKP